MDNPCDRVGPVLGPQHAMVRAPARAASPATSPAAVAAGPALPSAAPVVKLAFEFLVLTAARWGEVRGTEWTEIDATGRVWTISRRLRMKAKRAHRDPAVRDAR